MLTATAVNAQEPLPGDDFEPATMSNAYEDSIYEEKVAFPDFDGPIPTFNASYPSIPPPSYAYAPRTLGPRFYNAAADPFDPQPNPSLSRQWSASSGHSTSSTRSDMSMKGKRWVIE